MGAYTLLQDLTVATNSTSVVLNDFGTITKNDFVKVVFTGINPQGTNSEVRLLANSSTNTDYHNQNLQGNASTVSAARNNNNNFSRSNANETGFSISYIKLSENDRLNIFSNTNQRANGSLPMINFLYTTSSGATFASGITEFTLTTSVTNGIGTGSRIQIYKLAAEKVRDIIVETNSTQVDIPTTGIFDPAIDKDSEYLLVSDISNTVGQSDYYLTPNDLTTVTGYYHQRLTGNGSSAGTNRAQTPTYAITEQNLKALAYTHIKLSNIGAFTYQSYTQRFPGTSSLILHNYMGSSTAENITSITKLNIRSANTNAIGTGSRFTLYKLYE